MSSQALVAYTCNPSYSEGRDQGDHGSKPVQANSSRNTILKIPNTKRVGAVAQGVEPEFKRWYCKKKKKREKERKKRSVNVQ
jgi:hypothetical protein